MLFGIIQKLKENGITTIYISHKLEEVFRICDTVTILRDGKVIDVKPVKDVTRNEIIEKMVGRTIDMDYPKRPLSRAAGFEVRNCTAASCCTISRSLHNEIWPSQGVGAGARLAESVWREKRAAARSPSLQKLCCARAGRQENPSAC